MITLYTWATPNGRKVSVMLEECELPYTVHPIDIMSGAQFEAEYVAIGPNSKIPAIVDDAGPGGEPIALFESGAILVYLADRTGRFMPASARGRYEALQWLMFQMAAVGSYLWSGTPLPALRQGARALFHRSLPQRDRAPLQGHERAP